MVKIAKPTESHQPAWVAAESFIFALEKDWASIAKGKLGCGGRE